MRVHREEARLATILLQMLQDSSYLREETSVEVMTFTMQHALELVQEKVYGFYDEGVSCSTFEVLELVGRKHKAKQIA